MVKHTQTIRQKNANELFKCHEHNRPPWLGKKLALQKRGGGGGGGHKMS